MTYKIPKYTGYSFLLSNDIQSMILKHNTTYHVGELSKTKILEEKSISNKLRYPILNDLYELITYRTITEMLHNTQSGIYVVLNKTTFDTGIEGCFICQTEENE